MRHVCRGQRDDQRRSETPETCVVRLITQRQQARCNSPSLTVANTRPGRGWQRESVAFMQANTGISVLWHAGLIIRLSRPMDRTRVDDLCAAALLGSPSCQPHGIGDPFARVHPGADLQSSRSVQRLAWGALRRPRSRARYVSAVLLVYRACGAPGMVALVIPRACVRPPAGARPARRPHVGAAR